MERWPSIGTWHAAWEYPTDSPWQAPSNKDDWRDHMPPPLTEVVKAYECDAITHPETNPTSIWPALRPAGKTLVWAAMR